MTAIHEQRTQLINENARMIQQWLNLLSQEEQLPLLRSLVNGYPHSQLRAMNTHVKERLAAAQQERTP